MRTVGGAGGGVELTSLVSPMKDLRDPGGSNPLPPMYSRPNGCAGYVFDSGDYGVLGFCVRCDLTTK